MADQVKQDPRREFLKYRNAYIDCSRDGLIDSKDLEGLEKILVKTLDEIEKKMTDSNGQIKKHLLESQEGPNYIKFCEGMKNDWSLIRKHLQLRDKWLKSSAYNGDYINYGIGCIIYFKKTGELGTVMGGKFRELLIQDVAAKTGSLQRLFSEGKSYDREEIYPNLSGKEINSLRIYEEFPAKTKINYWLGLGLGVLIPPIVRNIGVYRKRKRGKVITDDEKKSEIRRSLAYNSGVGFIILDSIHPVVYPLRLGLPILYETLQWAFGTKKYLNHVDGQKAIEVRKVEKQEPKRDIPNPWDIKIPEIERMVWRGRIKWVLVHQ